MYSMDGTQLLWKGKPAKLAKGATGRRISDTMATDGKTLYFAQKRVELPATIDLDALQMRVFDENTFNLFGAILDDGTAVWQLNNRGDNELVKLDNAKFEDVARFDTPGVGFNYHLKDSVHVWYRGEIVAGLESAKAVVLGENIVTDGNMVWFFGKQSKAFSRTDITPVSSANGNDWLRSDSTFIKLECKNNKRDVSQIELAQSSGLPPYDKASEHALNALAKDMFAVFETYPQIIVPIDDMDWKKVRARSITAIQARFDGSKIVLKAGGVEPVTCDADGWYGGLCALWHHLQGRAGRLITYPNVGVMSPDGQEFQRRLIKENREEYIHLCGAVFAAGDESGARLMLHAYVKANHYRNDTPFDGLDKIVADLPRGLFENIAYAKRRDNFTNTTNLSAARHAIESGLLIDHDPRVRLEMLGLIHGTIISTNKKRQFFEKILTSILALQNTEVVTSVSEQTDSVVEAFIIAGLVEAEVNHIPMADLLEQIIRSQIVRGVNLPLNQSRLIEVLIQQDKDIEAEVAIVNFVACYGANFMLPGLYANRPLYKNIDEAVVAMRERADGLQR
jgi:hypothetical protein